MILSYKKSSNELVITKMNDTWRLLPRDIIDVILKYDNDKIRKRCGKYMNRISKTDFRYLLLKDRPKSQVLLQYPLRESRIVFFSNNKFEFEKHFEIYPPNHTFLKIVDEYGGNLWKSKNYTFINDGNVTIFIKNYDFLDYIYEDYICHLFCKI